MNASKTSRFVSSKEMLGNDKAQANQFKLSIKRRNICCVTNHFTLHGNTEEKNSESNKNEVHNDRWTLRWNLLILVNILERSRNEQALALGELKTKEFLLRFIDLIVLFPFFKSTVPLARWYQPSDVTPVVYLSRAHQTFDVTNT